MPDYELIEDEDGAPLPGYLQRRTQLWWNVRELLGDDEKTDRTMRRLAPVFHAAIEEASRD